MSTLSYYVPNVRALESIYLFVVEHLGFFPFLVFVTVPQTTC